VSRSYSKKVLLSRCKTQAAHQISEVNSLFSHTDEESILTAPFPGKWSAKQCLEHLISTLNLYIPRIKKELDKNLISHKDELKHGFIGYKFLTGILPKEDGTVSRTMKTFKSLQPNITGITKEQVVKDFAEKMTTLKSYLDYSSDKNLQKLKVTSAAGPLLRLRLGDVYPFLLNHNVRHILQARKAIETNLKRKGLSLEKPFQ